MGNIFTYCPFIANNEDDGNLFVPFDEEKEDEVEIKMDKKEFEQLSNEITHLNQKLDLNNGNFDARKQLYDTAKKIYKEQKSPVFIHKNIIQEIRDNPIEYNDKNALPLTLTMDKDFKTFDEAKFKQEFSAKMNIPIATIKIVSVIEGSTIVHTEILAFKQQGIIYTVGAIAEKMTDKEACQKLQEFGVFLAEFGKPIDTFKPIEQKLILAPKWNRIYDDSHIRWKGSLNNEKTEPYYCPIGWKKFTCRVTETCDEFDAKYLTWPVAYHGTHFSLTMMISFSRLRSGGQPEIKNASGADCFGTGVYFSPSIEYSAHPLYSHPKKMSSKAKEFAGQWVQVVLNCRLKPGCYSVHQGTIGNLQLQVDPNYNNNELEWLVHAPHGTYLDESQVIFCGYMIRTSECDPRYLSSSKWWNLNAYGQTLVSQWYEN